MAAPQHNSSTLDSAFGLHKPWLLARNSLLTAHRSGAYFIHSELMRLSLISLRISLLSWGSGRKMTFQPLIISEGLNSSLDLSKFNTANVTDMMTMFSNCRAFTSLDIRNFDVEKVTRLTSIFASVGNQAGTGSKTPIKVTSALHTALKDKGVSLGDYAEYFIVDIVDVYPM